MKIGIFLGYGPHVILKKEGLGRYLGGLLYGFTRAGHKVTIVSPLWLKETLLELLADFNIDQKAVAIVATKKIPPLWRIYKAVFLQNRPGKVRAVLQNFIYRLSKILSAVIKVFTETTHITTFLIWGLITCSIVGVSSILLLSLVFATGILYFLGRKIWRKTTAKMYQKLLEYFFSLYPNKFLSFMSNDMVDAEVKRLAVVGNTLRDKPDCWFVPGLFWPQAVRLNSAPIIFNAPDFIPELFPSGFADKPSNRQVDTCRETLRSGKWFITYSEYVRQSLLIEENRLPAEFSFAIKNANNDMSPHLAIHEDINKQNNTDKDFSKAFARSFLGKYQGSCYIFFASQSRPNKNILNLIKAFEFLLRKRFLHLKLFLTADLTKDTQIQKYINEHSLQNEVVSFYNVSAQHLAALYHSAELAVNPTLYEGGFPFTFGEGMSVGTPSIMSDIPQTREVLEPAGLEEIMFDPYDYRSIAEKIEWALTRRQELYEKEAPLYRELARRTPDVVAAEYVKTFEYVIDQERKIRDEKRLSAS